MIPLTIKEFQDMRKEGVFFFYSWNCGSCRLAVQEFERVDTTNWYKLDCEQNLDYFLSIGIDDIPVTRIYKSDTVVWEKIGILYDKQQRELFETLKKENVLV